MQKAIKVSLSDNLLGLYQKYKSIIRFMAVGVINTGVDFAAFTLLHTYLGFDKLLCQVLGYSIGIVNSFLMNKFWTFENIRSEFGTSEQALRFIVINAISLGISLIGLKLLNDNLGINVYVTKLSITAMAQAVNYLGYRMWVFRN